MRAIFISYRREDTEGQAGRLFDDLIMHFGDDSVFMDVAGLEPGRDFRRAIDEQVTSCGVLLAVIGKDWLDAKGESGRRRLDDPMDFVRLETASALKRDIPVIPVLVRGASMPRVEDLPEDLKELAFRNGVELTHARWDSDVQVLVKALRPYVQAKPEPTMPRPPSAPIEPSPTWRGSSRMIIAALVIVLVLAIVGYLWHRKSSEEAAREAAALVEVKRLAAADDEKAKAEANRINKEKIATDQADTRKRPEAKTQAQDVLAFRDWDGSWNLSWVYAGNTSKGEMKLRSDRFGIAGEYRDGDNKLLGTLKGTFVGGDFSKVTGEFANPNGSGENCQSGKQAGKRGGSFSLDLAKGGKSMTGWWDICTVGKQYHWEAQKR
jgi:TIR domain-containing protein